MPELTERIQQFVGTYSHLARTVRYDLLPGINEIAEIQASPNTDTIKVVDRMANYTARFPNACLKLTATDMILKAHYDSSLKPYARHKAGGVFL